MPDSPLYLLKRWEEKTLLSLAPTQSLQMKMGRVLLSRCLSEVVYITDKKEYALFYPTSLRFSTQAGDVPQMSKDADDAKRSVLTEFAADSKKIASVYAKHDKTMEWKYIHDAINYLAIYSKQLLTQN